MELLTLHPFAWLGHAGRTILPGAPGDEWQVSRGWSPLLWDYWLKETRPEVNLQHPRDAVLIHISTWWNAANDVMIVIL